MLISLSEIMTTKDKVEKVRIPIEMEELEFQGITYGFHKKNPVELAIRNLGNKKVSLEGNTSISLKLFCDRCLKEMTFPMDINIDKEIDFNLLEDEGSDEQDDMSYIIRYDLDVDILVYNEIIVSFPMKALCDENCKGMCKSCGTNLNVKTCDCDKTVYDPRMSVIQDIFKNNKEV